MTIELSEDEALVLFDLLSDHGSNGDDRALTIRHAAERNALWGLEAPLEKQLVAPFKQDYLDLPAAARARVEEQGGSW